MAAYFKRCIIARGKLYCSVLLLVIPFWWSCSNRHVQTTHKFQDELNIISDSLQAWTDSHSPVGVEVLILKDQEELLHKAYGWKDFENKVPLQTNSVFRVASMTKPLTATGILILKQRGQLEIDDKISKYLPNFKSIAGDSLSIEHLLRHSSGYGELQIWKDYGEELRLFDGLDSVVNALSQYEPAMPVGTEEYSSLNTILLCAILEKVSGMPAERFIKENILSPLKMTNTYLLEEPGTDWFKKIPRTYGVHDGEPEVYWIPGQHPSMYPFFRGATGAATTVKDYARFLQMWLNKGKLDGKRVLEESTVEEALNNNGKSIGLHWFVPESPDVSDVFGHAGWYGTCGAAYQEDNAIALYFTQTYNNPKISEFYELLSYSGILEHKGPYDIQKELPNLPEQPNSEFLKAYEGTYRAVTSDGLEWIANIVMTEGHLEANIRSEVDAWTDKLVFVKPDTFAPGFIKGSTALAVAPKVFYQFKGVGSFDVTVLGNPEFSFKTIKSSPAAHSEH